MLGSSYDAGTRTVEATFSTGVRVWRGGIWEELEISSEAVDLARVQSGICPLLNAHNRFDVGAVLGTIESASIRGGALIGRIRFADTPAGREAEGLVTRGELAGVSIGYGVRTWQLSGEHEGFEIYRATSWELTEVSLVPVPADPTALIRSEQFDMTMTRNLPSSPSPAPAPAVTPAPAPPLHYVTARQLSDQARAAGIPDAAAAELLVRHAETPFTREGMMAEIGRAYAARDVGGVSINRHSVPASPLDRTGAGGHPATIVRGVMEQALLSRINGTSPEDERVRQYRGVSMLGMARMLLEERGEQVRFMGDRDVLERAMHTTSDFPILLANVGQTYLQQQYERAISGVRMVARRREVRDFNDIRNLRMSNLAPLRPVNEAGEFKYRTIDEAEESYRVKTWGEIFSVSRQTLINDHLGAFANPLALMAEAAAETEAQALADLLTANNGFGAKIYSSGAANGRNLYAAEHGNLAASGGDISATTLSEGRQAMRKQVAMDGKTFINVPPKYLVVSSDMETLGEQFLAVIQPAVASEANPFAGRMELVVDPRLPAKQWRLFADPNAAAGAAVIEYAYLEGAPGPQMRTREGFETDHWQARVTLDFGAGLVDWRGTYMNPGAG